MGQKVNFNKKQKNNLKTLGIVLFVFIIIYALLKSLKNVNDFLVNDENVPNLAGTYYNENDDIDNLFKDFRL